MPHSAIRAFALALGACLSLSACGPADPQSPAPSPAASPPLEVSPAPSAPADRLHFVDAWGEWHDAQIDPEVEPHRYDWSKLSWDGAGLPVYNDDRFQVRRGVDVSVFQGAVDWERVKADGYDFAFVRLGFRGYGDSGILKLDDRYRANILGAQAAGLDVGVYFFSQAVNEAEAREEAELVLQSLEGLDLTLPVVYDPELIRDAPARTDDVTGEQFTRNTVAFCEQVKAAGYEPMVYSNMIWEAFLFDLKALADYPIWYADYEPTPQSPYRFTFWQCACTGKVAGIEGDVDINLWFLPLE